MTEPTVSPMLAYEDPAKAADWLVEAFGLTELSRYADDDGRVTHVVMALGDGHVHLGSPSPHYVGPRRLAEGCEQARRWRDESPYIGDGVLAHVDDLDAHHERARAAGALVLTPPEQGGGGYQYRVEDLEGHRWMFAQRS